MSSCFRQVEYEAVSFKFRPSELYGCYYTLILSRVALQGVYNVERSRAIGNEPLVEALRELIKYEVRGGAGVRVSSCVEFRTREL